MHGGIAGQQTKVGAVAQALGQELAITGAQRQLVGVDDGHRLVVAALQMVDAVEREAVQRAPAHRPGMGHPFDAPAVPGQRRIQQVAARTAVVQQDWRDRIQPPQVAHQVDDTVGPFMDEAGMDVGDRALRRESRLGADGSAF